MVKHGTFPKQQLSASYKCAKKTSLFQNTTVSCCDKCSLPFCSLHFNKEKPGTRPGKTNLESCWIVPPADRNSVMDADTARVDRMQGVAAADPDMPQEHVYNIRQAPCIGRLLC